jgi:single-strand DNA-binding protein
MSSFNKVILLGNLTRDPEQRTLTGGTALCKLGLASTRKYRDRDGNPQEYTVFVDVDAFGKTAETLGKYLRKGSPVLIEGRLKLDQWENDQGQKRSKLGVICETFQFIPKGQKQTNPSDQSDPTIPF